MPLIVVVSPTETVELSVAAVPTLIPASDAASVTLNDANVVAPVTPSVELRLSGCATTTVDCPSVATTAAFVPTYTLP